MDLRELQDRIVAQNREQGWYDEEVPFSQAMALLHDEVSEAHDAWRHNGFRAWKVRKLSAQTLCAGCLQRTDSSPECSDHPDKPEGVASEFADVLIRLLDYAGRYGVNLEAAVVEKLRYNRSRGYRWAKI